LFNVFPQWFYIITVSEKLLLLLFVVVFVVVAVAFNMLFHTSNKLCGSDINKRRTQSVDDRL
jgi:cell division protein FtsL